MQWAEDESSTSGEVLVSLWCPLVLDSALSPRWSHGDCGWHQTRAAVRSAGNAAPSLRSLCRWVTDTRNGALPFSELIPCSSSSAGQRVDTSGMFSFVLQPCHGSSKAQTPRFAITSNLLLSCGGGSESSGLGKLFADNPWSQLSKVLLILMPQDLSFFISHTSVLLQSFSV